MIFKGEHVGKSSRKTRGGMNQQSQQRSQQNISESRQSKEQSKNGYNLMNAEKSKNWREDAKGIDN